jgi:hypothetical protein
MDLRDIGRGTAARYYDQLQAHYPQQVERLRTAVRREMPGISEAATRQRVVRRLVRTPALYRLLRECISGPQPESGRSSPSEQAKGLTAGFHYRGELTGGNFGASF